MPNLSSTLAKLTFGAAVAGMLGAVGPAARAADYPTTVSNLNPVAYYRLNDTTSPATDFSTNLGSLGAAANAYYNGVVGTDYTHPVAGALAGDSDTAAQTLTGTGCIGVPHNPILNGNTFTYECWFDPTGNGAAILSDVDFLAAGRYGFIFYYGVNATWDIRIYTGNGTAFAANIEDNTVVTPVNGWYHFVVTCDGSTAILYVNGQADNQLALRRLRPSPRRAVRRRLQVRRQLHPGRLLRRRGRIYQRPECGPGFGPLPKRHQHRAQSKLQIIGFG